MIVCHEAAQEMGGLYINSGLPKSMYRHWFQTTLSCIGKEPLW